MTISQYLGTGTTSRGRMGITPSLGTRVITPPYLRNAQDKEAVVQGIEYVRGVLSQIGNLTWVVPTVNQTTTAFVNSVSSAISSPSFWRIVLMLSPDPSNSRLPRIESLDWLVHDWYG
jgi:cellobiose dehydrogenase (acceptor)